MQPNAPRPGNLPDLARARRLRGASLARVATLALFWGSGFLWIKVALRGLSPTQILFVRLALGAAILVAILYARGERLPGDRRTWLHLTIAAVFGNVIPYLLFALAERDVDSSVAGMMNATTPLWTVVITALAGQGKRLSGGQVTGLMLGAVGTVLIFAPWNSGSQFTSWGALASLFAAFNYGVSFVYMGHFLAGRGVSSVALSAGQLLSASGIALLALPLFGGLTAPQWRADAVASVVILGVLGTGLAYALNYRIIADDGAVAASVVTYLLPVVAVVLGALVLDEALTAHAVIGVVVVIAGVAAARRKPRRQAAAASLTRPA